MPAAVGVDAGGSRTIAAVECRDGSTRTFEGEPANPHVCGVERAADAIAATVRGALEGERLGAIAAGVAGAGGAGMAERLADALRARFPGARVAVSSDAHLALRGSIPSGDGIVLVAGTGSIAYAEIGERHVRAGGGGYALGDEGSGYAIGAAALRLLLRRFDGRTPTDPLLDALALHACASSADDVIAFAYGSSAAVPTIAGVAPIVLEFANAGERSAHRIVQQSALDLFELVRAVWRLGRVGDAEMPLAFSGGLLRENSVLSYLVETRIGNEFPHLRVVKNGAGAYLAALAEARKLL